MASASINIQRSNGKTASLAADIDDDKAVAIIEAIAALLTASAIAPEPAPEPPAEGV